MLRTSRSARTLALLAALACLAVLAVPTGALADGPLSDRVTDHAAPPPSTPSSDSPSDRGRLAIPTTDASVASTDDGGSGGMDAWLIVAISLGGVALVGGAWVLVRRSTHRPLVPRTH